MNKKGKKIRIYEEVKKENGSDSEDSRGSEDCEHTICTTNESGSKVCIKCSEIIQDSSESVGIESISIKRRTMKSIKDDLDKYNFPEDVKEKANDIYVTTFEGKKTHKGTTRKAVVFACVHNAYKQLNKPKDPQETGSIMGIDKSIMNRGIRLLSPLNTGKRLYTKKYIKPMDLVPNILDKLDIERNIIPNIQELYDKVEGKCSKMSTSTPQSIAAALVYYYLLKNDPNLLSKIRFNENVNPCAITIKSISDAIDKFCS